MSIRKTYKLRLLVKANHKPAGITKGTLKGATYSVQKGL